MSCITRHGEPPGEITTRSWASRAAARAWTASSRRMDEQSQKVVPVKSAMTMSAPRARAALS